MVDNTASEEKTALWIWKDLESEASITTITADDIARIRKLIVYWETAENGAAGLLDEDFLEIAEGVPDDMEQKLELFMNLAALPKSEGMIRNPYAGSDSDNMWALQHVPDQRIADLFRAGEDIDYKATDDDLALWGEANRRYYGIDPKRPFGYENVARDMRKIVNPDNKRDKKALNASLPYLESRLMLTLQYFIQNAELEPGTYQRGSNWTWGKLSDEDGGEALTRAIWGDRMWLQMTYESEDYAQMLKALNHLVWNNRVTGTYAELEKQFNLGSDYDGKNHTRYEGSQEERLVAALANFPDHRDHTPRPWFTLCLARMYNAKARFAEAKEVLERANLFTLKAEDVDLSSVNPLAIAWLEGLITRRGLDQIGEEKFQSILANSDPDWRTRPTIWKFVWAIQHNGDDYRDTEGSPGIRHAQATAAQIETMRGGYVPEEGC